MPPGMHYDVHVTDGTTLKPQTLLTGSREPENLLSDQGRETMEPPAE